MSGLPAFLASRYFRGKINVGLPSILRVIQWAAWFLSTNINRFAAFFVPNKYILRVFQFFHLKR